VNSTPIQRIVEISTPRAGVPLPKWHTVRLYQPHPNAFVFMVESEQEDLILEPLTTGCHLYSPYGTTGKTEFQVRLFTESAQQHFENCRAWQNLETHTPNGTTKYFLCKVLLREHGWSQAEEDSLFHRCSEFVFREEWLHTEPVVAL